MSFQNYAAHAGEVRARATQAVALQEERVPALGVDPRLVLVFEVTGPIPAEDFARSDLSVVDSSERTVVVAFADDPQLGGFLERLNRYGEGRVGGTKGAPHQGFFDAITSVRPYGPEDRVTDRLATDLETVSGDVPVIVDAELWCPGDEETMTSWLTEIEGAITAAAGEVLDRYSNPSAGVAIVRGRLPARSVQELAQIDLIATLDREPEPDIEAGRALEIDIDSLPPVPAPLPDAPLVGLIDSGVRSAHPLLAGCARCGELDGRSD